MNACIVRLSSMGDVVCATSLFSALKRRCPAAAITFITFPFYGSLFSRDSRVERVIEARRGGESEVRAQLAQTEWDMVVDLQNNRRSRRILEGIKGTAESGVFDKLHFKRLLLVLLRTNVYGDDETVPARYVKAAGLECESGAVPPPSLQIDPRDFPDAVKENHAAPLLALLPFSAWKNKQWPLENFIETGKYFASKAWRVVVLGGPKDSAEAQYACQCIGPRSSSYAGKLSLYENACVLKRCTLAVGNDTGLSHMARACGVATGVIYGATTRHLGFFPFGSPPFRVFEHSLRCRPCHPHGGNFCIRMGRRTCLHGIGPEKVIIGLEELAAAAAAGAG
jgi:heptosyltransferase-2